MRAPSSWPTMFGMVLASLFLVLLFGCSKNWAVKAVDCETWTDKKTFRKKVEDTLIRQDNPTATAGSETSLTIDMQDPQETQVLLKFKKLKLPKGAALYDAKLSLFAAAAACCGAKVYGYRMFIPWTESKATWQDPFFGGVYLGADALSDATFSFDATVSKEFVTVDVTQDVDYWLKSLASSNDGWVLKSNSGDGFDFYSSEWQKKKRRPKLVLRYCFPEATPSSSGNGAYVPTPPFPTPPFPTTPSVNIGPSCANSITQLRFGSGGVDTLLFEDEPDRSGKSEQLLTANVKNGNQGECQILLQFPGIPESPHPDTIVDEALLDLFVTEDSVGPINAHRMTTPWTDQSTWRFFGWGVTVGDQTESSASFTLDEKQTGWIQVDVRSDVQEWIKSGVTNWGWVFVNSDAEKWTIKSSDNSDGSFRPKLSLTLTCTGSAPSPPPPTPMPPPPSPPPTREPTRDPTQEPTNGPTIEPTEDIPVGPPPGGSPGGGNGDDNGDGLPDGVPPGIPAPDFEVNPPLGPAPGGGRRTSTTTTTRQLPVTPPASNRQRRRNA